MLIVSITNHCFRFNLDRISPIFRLNFFFPRRQVIQHTGILKKTHGKKYKQTKFSTIFYLKCIYIHIYIKFKIYFRAQVTRHQFGNVWPRLTGGKNTFSKGGRAATDWGVAWKVDRSLFSPSPHSHPPYKTLPPD